MDTMRLAEYARIEKAQARNRDRCTWRRRSPIAGEGDARGISPTPNAW